MKYNFDEIIDRNNTNSIKWKLKDKEKDVIPMWIADMDFRTAQPIIDALKEKADHGIYGYSVMSDDVYNSIINWFNTRHDWKIEKEWITFSIGIVPALHAFCKIFLNEGDKVLMMTPIYRPFTMAAKRNNREIVYSELKYENQRYEINFEDFEQKAKDPAIKLCFICSPHNPGGRLWTREELTKLGRICTDNDVLIVTDEIHCDLVYPGNKHISFGTLDDDIVDNSIICTAPSKTFNLAGLQLSSLIIKNKELRDRYIKYVTDCGYDIGVNEAATFSIIAMKAAYSEGAEWLDQLLDYIKGNRDFFIDYVKKNIPGVKVMVPDATYLIWIDLRSYGLNCVQMHERLRYEAGVWLDEGYIFGKAAEGFERVNIACARSVVEEAAKRMADFLNNL